MRTRKPQVMWAVQCQWGRMAPYIVPDSVRPRRKDVVKLFFSWWDDNPEALKVIQSNLREGIYRFVKVSVIPMEGRDE